LKKRHVPYKWMERKHDEAEEKHHFNDQSMQLNFNHKQHIYD
jgi:hypothetical protein